MFKHFGSLRVLPRAQVFAILLTATPAMAEGKEPLAILQLGAATEWALQGGNPGLGPTAAIEFSPIKNWLEIEAGAASLFRKGQAEWDYNLIFKKQFNLSPYVEFEPGAGPVWMHAVSLGRTTNSVGAEIAFEFMIWPTLDRKYGWFVEPSYMYSFARGHEQSIGISGGLLIPIR